MLLTYHLSKIQYELIQKINKSMSTLPPFYFNCSVNFFTPIKINIQDTIY